MIEYEVKGGSISKNDIVCITKNSSDSINESVAGEQYELEGEERSPLMSIL